MLKGTFIEYYLEKFGLGPIEGRNYKGQILEGDMFFIKDINKLRSKLNNKPEWF